MKNKEGDIASLFRKMAAKKAESSSPSVPSTDAAAHGTSEDIGPSIPSTDASRISGEIVHTIQLTNASRAVEDNIILEEVQVQEEVGSGSTPTSIPPVYDPDRLPQDPAERLPIGVSHRMVARGQVGAAVRGAQSCGAVAGRGRASLGARRDGPAKMRYEGHGHAGMPDRRARCGRGGAGAMVFHRRPARWGRSGGRLLNRSRKRSSPTRCGTSSQCSTVHPIHLLVPTMTASLM